MDVVEVGVDLVDEQVGFFEGGEVVVVVELVLVHDVGVALFGLAARCGEDLLGEL